MPREVSDQEYQWLQGRAQVADFVESIYNDPQLAKEAKALIKRKYPQLQIPDYDIEQRVNDRLDEEKKRRDDAEKAAKDAAEDTRYKETRSKVQKDYGFTDDGMKDLEKFMVERSVGDYEVAATYHAAKNPKPIAADDGDGRWHHDKEKDFAEVSKDPEGWARNEILGALRRDEERMRGWR
jgi:hypothetical protein